MPLGVNNPRGLVTMLPEYFQILHLRLASGLVGWRGPPPGGAHGHGQSGRASVAVGQALVAIVLHCGVDGSGAVCAGGRRKGPQSVKGELPEVA